MIPTDFAEANKTLWDINDQLVKAAYAASVNWEKIILGNPDDLLDRKKIKYQPTSNRVDRSVKSVMNSIDELSERIRGTRPVYEMLCEFAHPNVGLILSL